MKVSIITVNKDNAIGLEETIKSVVFQTFTDFEFIIIDGNSTDNSINIIEKYSNNITYWVSESDNGIFHAMNKGIRQAKGEYVIFMNSGDCFLSKETLMNVFSKETQADLLAGNVIMDGKRIRQKRRLPQKITFYYFWTNTIHHQGTFIKRNLFDEIGLYDESLKVSSDWIFFLLAIVKYNKSIEILEEYIALRQPNGIASSKEAAAWSKEIRDVTIQKYFPYFYDDYKNYHKLKRFTFTRLKKHIIWRLQYILRG